MADDVTPAQITKAAKALRTAKALNDAKIEPEPLSPDQRGKDG